MGGKVAFWKGKKLSEETKRKMSETHQRNKVSGDKHFNWKDGIKKDNKGYIFIYKPEHPFCNCRGFVLEHRLVAESSLGRFLTRNEEVHHKDENPSNNVIDNLIVLTKSEHASIHHKGKTISEEQKIKNRILRLGTHHSEESKKKISESVRETCRKRKLNKNI